MDINQRLTEELDVKRWQIDAAVQLIDEGNTIPFISRYRKEATGELNDEQLRKLYERLVYLRNLEEKKEQVISSIEEQGKLTEELKKQILAAETLVAVEDLYRPYRPKRRTRATIAKEKGLEPLAALITLQKTKEPLEKAAEAYISEEKGVESAKDAISGACDIIAESISDEAAYRTWIRETTMRKGKVTSQAKDPEAESVYEMYYEFEEAVAKLAGHRILALNRGEKEKFLTVKVEAPEEDILRYLERKVIRTENPYTTPVLKETIADSYNRLIGPAIEREVRNELTEKAEDGAIEVFGKNLHQLLMQPPIAGKVVLGWDPAFRTGCKLAVVDETGKVIGTTVIYPTAPTTEKKIQASKDLLKKIDVTTPSDTRIVSITVADHDPVQAMNIANSVRENASTHIQNVMDIDAVNVAETANMPTEKASPSCSKWALIGGLLGCLGISAIILIRYLMDDTIKSSDDIEKYLGLSTLALIPMKEDEVNSKKKKKKYKQSK